MVDSKLILLSYCHVDILSTVGRQCRQLIDSVDNGNVDSQGSVCCASPGSCAVAVHDDINSCIDESQRQSPERVLGATMVGFGLGRNKDGWSAHTFCVGEVARTVVFLLNLGDASGKGLFP